jgi:hypothetical protein
MMGGGWWGGFGISILRNLLVNHTHTQIRIRTPDGRGGDGVGEEEIKAHGAMGAHEKGLLWILLWRAFKRFGFFRLSRYVHLGQQKNQPIGFGREGGICRFAEGICIIIVDGRGFGGMRV